MLWKLPEETPETGEWQEGGPGARHRLLTYSNGLQIREDDLKCGDCGTADIDPFIVSKPMWEQYGNGRGFLCPQCFEKRLGRKLTLQDLVPVHANKLLFKMLIQGWNHELG